MKWRMMVAAAAAGMVFASSAFADVTIKYSGGSCYGVSLPSTEYRYPGVSFDSAGMESAIAQVNSTYGWSGVSVKKNGSGRYDYYVGNCLVYSIIDSGGGSSGGSTASAAAKPASSSGAKPAAAATASDAGTPEAAPSEQSTVATASSAGTPASSSSIQANTIVRNNIFSQAKPKAQSKKKSSSSAPASAQPASETGDASQPSIQQSIGKTGILTFGAADVFFNRWEIGDADGETVGLNPSITWGESMAFAVTIPFHVISGDDDTIFGVGLDGAFTCPFRGAWDNFSAGFHVYGMGFFGGDDPESTLGGGPFLSFNYQINPKWILSLGALVELTKPDGVDLVTELVPGVNLGYSITDNIALNGFGIYHRDLDSDAEYNGYTDVGADLSLALGSWSLSGGAKTSVGVSDFTSWEVYLGSGWVF